MFTATKDLILPSTTTGSFPRPRWFDVSMWGRPLDTCMQDVRFREKLQDALAVVISDQERAGLDIVTQDAHAARRRREIARDHLHRGGLAGAVGSQEAEDLAFRDGEIDSRNRGNGTETLRQTFDLDHGLGMVSNFGTTWPAVGATPIREIAATPQGLPVLRSRHAGRTGSGRYVG